MNERRRRKQKNLKIYIKQLKMRTIFYIIVNNDDDNVIFLAKFQIIMNSIKIGTKCLRHNFFFVI